MVPWNFLELFGGWGICDRDFGKFDLRLRNSVYAQAGRRPQKGVVGGGWGQPQGKTESPKYPHFAPLRKLEVSVRDTSLADRGQGVPVL